MFIDKAVSKEVDYFVDDKSRQWFKVGRILSLHKSDDYDLDDFTEEHQLPKSCKKILRKLDKKIHNEPFINFYEEDDQNPDKAVNIFIRINSGGTPLSFADILFSITIANWEKDARTEINNVVDSIRSKGFNIDKNFILRSFLYLYHKDVRFKVTNFNNNFIQQIEDNWENIRNSIISLFDLMHVFGLNDFTLTSYNAILPILYYLYHHSIYEDFHKKKQFKSERIKIKQWLLCMIVRRVFGGQPDTVLQQSRKAFTSDIEKEYITDKNDNFPNKEINKEIKRISDVSDDYIDDLLKTQKDTRYCFSILALLYPNLDYKNNDFHQDHLHPATRDLIPIHFKGFFSSQFQGHQSSLTHFFPSIFFT